MNLKGKTIQLRFVEEPDASFILKLRIDPKYNQHLSPVNQDLDAQIKWIRNYKKEEVLGKQFYFIIERLDGVPCGTVRVYDLREDSFCWGSWILNENKTRYASLESAFLVYDFGFKKLGYSKSHFDVMKENNKVIAFHRAMGALETGEDQQNFYFEISEKAVEDARKILKGKVF
ncbi:RimJ/RimL family protein N-acetyltransferase [Desulfobotulus alkaliphilus]|uniref:RimJ/RimL family protein N-acetyltransferase n=1 Tax=Desulfobotulus alkaliphilus TaxID=622671 RepID=A0A562S712_9BACT|nr:GNAT family N-acetyltransferase [Desulfobotulus alkaliphilus]TWI76913.1 RimJ/RimL family protein N-acetyltransferase [Desulfobotulus alkaliphilus]